MGFKEMFQKSKRKQEKTMRRTNTENKSYNANLNLTILIITSNVNGHYTSIKTYRLPEWIND